MKILSLPFDENTIKSLKLGEVIFISGSIITGRDEMHIHALEKVKNNEDVPKEIYNSVLYHCGPIMDKKDGKYVPISAGPTTSARMNKIESKMIETFGIKAIIGKGGMSSEVCEAMKKNCCIYLAATGGAAVTLADQIKEVEGVEWEHLGMAEAIWKLRVDKLGPLVVAIDANGKSLYDEVNSKLKRSF